MNEQDYLDIEAYLQGELQAAERLKLERRAKSDPTFAAALADREELNAHLRAEANEPDFRAMLKEVMGQPPSEATSPEPDSEATVVKMKPHTKRRQLWGWVAVAATILLLVIAAQFWLNDSAAGGEELFAQHAPIALVERGTADAAAQRAEAAFNNGRYEEAIQPLRNFLSVQTVDNQASLALGISLMETDQPAEAERIFQKIAAGTSSLAPFGDWYLALMAARRGDNDAASDYLDNIPQENTFLTRKANELREQF